MLETYLFIFFILKIYKFIFKTISKIKSFYIFIFIYLIKHVSVLTMFFHKLSYYFRLFYVLLFLITHKRCSTTYIIIENQSQCIHWKWNTQQRWSNPAKHSTIGPEKLTWFLSDPAKNGTRVGFDVDRTHHCHYHWRWGWCR
jgi:hypothetical protein